MEGFGSADIWMENISRRNVTFGQVSPSANKSLAGAATTVDPYAGYSSEELVDALLTQCLHHCEEGEEEFIVVDDVKHSCCQE